MVKDYVIALRLHILIRLPKSLLQRFSKQRVKRLMMVYSFTITNILEEQKKGQF